VCVGALLIAAGLLTFIGVKLLRENHLADRPEKKVHPAIPIGMLIVAALLAFVAVRSILALSQ
jgi:hypothetical protein